MEHHFSIATAKTATNSTWPWILSVANRLLSRLAQTVRRLTTIHDEILT